MKSKSITESENDKIEEQMTLRILHVDDNPDFMDLTANYIKKSEKNFEIFRASNAEEALEILRNKDNIDCVLSDYKMPGKTGLDLLKDIRHLHEDIPFILLTGNGSEEVASKAMSNNATDYFRKRSDSESYKILAQRIENAVSSYRAKNRRERTLKRINDGYIELNKNYKIKFSNKKAEDLLNFHSKDYKGDKFWEHYKNRDSSFSNAIRNSFEKQEEVSNKEFDPVNNNWFYISIYPSEDSISIYIDDITEREVSQKQKEVQRIQQEILAEKAKEIVGVNEIEEGLEIMSNGLWQGIDCERVSISGKNLETVVGNQKSSSNASKFDIEVNNSNWGQISLKSDRELKENDLQFLNSIKSMLANTIQRLDREKKLRKYQRIVEISDEGLYLTNSDSEIEFANNFFLNMTGLNEEEVLGENIADVLDLEIDGEACDQMRKLIDGEKNMVDEKGTLEKPNGDRTYYRNKFKLLYPEKEDFKGTLGLLKDVTDHEKKKKDLKKSRKRSERERDRLVQNVPGAAFRIEKKNGEWELDYISEGSEDLFGEDHKKIEEDGWQSLMVDDDVRKIKKVLTKPDETSSEPVNFRVENSNGQIRWIMAKGSVVKAEEGNNFIEGVLIDITDWKEYKKDLKKTQILVEASPEPMFILDNDLKIKRINKAAKDTVNVEKEILIDKDIEGAAKEIISSNKSNASIKNIENLEISKYLKQNSKLKDLKNDLNEFLASDLKETSLEEKIDLISGGTNHVRFEVRKIFDEKGNTEGLAGIVHDITDMEKKKRSQKNKLDEFSSLVSHDLRNPLNLAQGYLDLARESESDEDFEVIEKAHKRMENIIDELLLITTEKEEVDKEKVELSEVFKEAFYFSGSDNLEYDIKDDTEILADRSGLISIFENLISNSEEHNNGKIKIRLGTTEEGFYYEDDGEGIPKEKRDEVFEYGISSKNSGIGLSIVRRIVEINGWNIKACESENGGARFEIST